MELKLRDGNVLHYDGAQVMGIVNVTPDSFFSGSRYSGEDNLRQRVRQIISEGGTMIDVGAYSTRPDADEVSADEELARLAEALPFIVDELQSLGCRCASSPRYVPVSVDTFRADVARQSVLQFGADIPISIDTFRPSVARMAVEQYHADIINDVSGGMLDDEMLGVVADVQAPYILMHMRGTPKTMQSLTDYPEGVTNAVVDFFSQQLHKLEEACQRVGKGLVSVILDPGFGFAKTIEQNYQLYGNIPSLKSLFPDYPLLVGISRKSMIYKLLGTDADNALNGTSVLNALAVASGAEILRVHDVKEASNVVNQMNR